MLSISEKLDAWIEHDLVGGCRLWTGQLNEHGYGILTHGRGNRWLAHRKSYEVCRGEIPDEACVLHKCDTPACVNPSHLFLGSRADNIADMYRKGRGAPSNWPTSRRGAEVAHSVLTEAQVLAMRARVAAGERASHVARDYPVGRAAGVNAIRGKTWTQLPGAVPTYKRRRP